MNSQKKEQLNHLPDNQSQLRKIRHSAEHVLMHAMERLGYPHLKAMGPATADGFYFDFELLESSISEDDFPKIEAEMYKIIKADIPIIREEITAEAARKLFKNNPYKQEWIDEAERKKQPITVYWTGEPHSDDAFVDLCAGPHVESTSKIGAVKLLTIAGAYWRGNEANKMLTRIYGTAFSTQEELNNYLKQREEAKKRDHKILGPKLDLFMFHETAPGSPYWLPNGLTVFNELLAFWREEHASRGYQEVSTPLINKQKLWEISGHWEHYKQDMFVADMGEGNVYGVKAMNCPNAMIIFGHKTRSYRDLPLRLSDSDILHRYEQSGELNGLLRVRAFRQDDSHNFITEDQIESEYDEILEIANIFYGVFDLTYKLRLGTRPEKYMGDLESWERAEASLTRILDKHAGAGNYEIAEGDGAFYGPKIDIVMQDALGRDWQMGTIQLDFQQPKRFGLKYIDQNGQEKTPIVIHRVIYGSLERFIGILIEHFAGAFPVWLAPTQAVVLPVSDKHLDYAKSIKDTLAKHKIRVSLDDKNETIGNKIRKAQEQKTPYMLIVGDQEVDHQTVNLRLRDGQQLGEVSIDTTTNRIHDKIATKSLEL